MKKLLLEIVRWSLRLHGLIHVGQVYSNIISGDWIGASLGAYIITIEILSSFLIPNEHIHCKPFKTEVHDKCD